MEWATLDSDLVAGALGAPPSSALRRALTARRAALHSALWRLEQQAGTLDEIADALTETLRAGHKLLTVGNGGSAAEAQHFAGELVGRFLRDRQAYAALALTCDSSVLTAIGNDYGFDAIFERQVSALGQPGDVLVAISTSGNSANVIRSIEAAHDRDMSVIALTGKGGGQITSLLHDTDIHLCVPHDRTMRIQEVHIVLLHALCDGIDALLLGDTL
jgi:D-sedoheptulose 7-phosphate isomerase